MADKTILVEPPINKCRIAPAEHTQASGIAPGAFLYARRRGARMQIEMKKLSEIIPYEKNPRKNDDAVKYVQKSIEEFGFKVPIVIDKDGIIVAGHTRYKAAKKLKLKEVPCITADDLTPEQVKAFRLADNKVGEMAEWDFNLLDAELPEIVEIDMEQFGFNLGISMDDFGEDFTLPSGDKNPICQMTFTLHEEQKNLIDYALSIVDEPAETYGNTNKNGNKLFEVVRQWAEQRK